MLSRRVFLVSTAAVAVAPQLVGGMELSLRGECHVVAEACAAGRCFADPDPDPGCGTIMPVLDDPSDLLFKLEDKFSRGAVDRIIGLTRPSTKFLIEQVAAAHGLQTHYHGTHRYEFQSLRHEYFAPASLLAALKTNRLDCGWGGELARCLRRHKPDSGASTSFSTDSQVSYGQTDVRQLSSFLLVRA